MKKPNPIRQWLATRQMNKLMAHYAKVDPEAQPWVARYTGPNPEQHNGGMTLNPNYDWNAQPNEINGEYFKGVYHPPSTDNFINPEPQEIPEKELFAIIDAHEAKGPE